MPDTKAKTAEQPERELDVAILDRDSATEIADHWHRMANASAAREKSMARKVQALARVRDIVFLFDAGARKMTVEERMEAIMGIIRKASAD